MPITNDKELAEGLEKVLFVLEEAIKYLRDPKLSVAGNGGSVAGNGGSGNSDDFEMLRALLVSHEWPEAAPEYMICEDTDEDKVDRAVGIMELLKVGLADKKVLDFGCGEGHFVAETAKVAAKAIGFDIEKAGRLWEGDLLTTDWEKIKQGGPFYDVALLFDVLDHCQDPVSALLRLREVCDSKTYIFCRCHPWMGPHAGHHYRKLNKAYVHLVFTEDELRQMGVDSVFTQKKYFPLDDTGAWFREGGFKIVEHRMHQISVPVFFKDNFLIRKRLPLNFYDAFPEWQMSQVFNDYVLKVQ